MEERTVKIYVYPYVITPEDELRDGPNGAVFEIKGATILIWMDLVPDAWFTHPTAYVLIAQPPVGTPGTAPVVTVHEGGWWPELNGEQILHGQNTATTVTGFG